MKRLFFIVILLLLGGFFALTENVSALSPLDVGLEIKKASLGEIKGSFTLKNRSEEVFTDLKYVLYLKQLPEVKTYKNADGVEVEEINNNNYLIKAERSAESILIRPGREERKDFVFSYPKNIPSGEYEFSIDIIDGQVGDNIIFDEIKNARLEGNNGFLEIKRDGCRVVRGKEEFFQEEGPNFESGEIPQAKCLVYNPNNSAINFGSEITYGEFGVFNYSNANTQTIKSGEYAIGPKEEKEIIVKLPSLTKPQAYQAFVNFVNSKGEIISVAPSFRWIIRGEGARIVAIKPNQTFYQRGDNAEITLDFVGSPDIWWQIFGDEQGSALKDFNINIKINDQDGALCAEKSEPFSGNIGDGDIHNINVVLKIKQDCQNPKIAANFSKGGSVLSSQEKSFVSGGLTSQKEISWKTAAAAAIVLLAIAAASVIYKKRSMKIFLLVFLFVSGAFLYIFLAGAWPKSLEAAIDDNVINERCEGVFQDSFCFGFKQTAVKNNVALVKPEILDVKVTTLDADGRLSEGSATNEIKIVDDGETQALFYINQQDKYINFSVKMRYSYNFASGANFLCANSFPRKIQTDFVLTDYGQDVGGPISQRRMMGTETWIDKEVFNLSYSIDSIEAASVKTFILRHPFKKMVLKTWTAGSLLWRDNFYPGNPNLPMEVIDVAGGVPLYPAFQKKTTENETYEELFGIYFEKETVGGEELYKYRQLLTKSPKSKIKPVVDGRPSSAGAGANIPAGRGLTINLGDKINLTALNGSDPDYKDYIKKYKWAYTAPGDSIYDEDLGKSISDCDRFPKNSPDDPRDLYQFSKGGMNRSSCRNLTNDPSLLGTFVLNDDATGDLTEFPSVSASFAPTKTGVYWFRVRSDSRLSSPGYVHFGGEDDQDDNYVRVEIDNVIIPPQPDLIINSFSYSPPAPIIGNSISFSGVIRNQGGAGAGASNSRLSMQKVGNPWQDISPDMSTGALSAGGGSESENWSWIPTAIGDYLFKICADATNIVSEAFEDNNCTLDIPFTVSPPPVPPTASFSCVDTGDNNSNDCAVYDVGKLGNSLTFKNNSSDSDGSIVGSIWKIFNEFGAPLFPDNPCPLASPVCDYTYTLGIGKFNSSLKVTDNAGLSNETSQQPFTIKKDINAKFECSLNAGGPFANCSVIAPKAGETVYFKDISTPSDGATIITSWSWNFGDGSPVGTTQNSTHIYSTDGNYSVTLIATDNNSIDGPRSGNSMQSIIVDEVTGPTWIEVIPR